MSTLTVCTQAVHAWKVACGGLGIAHGLADKLANKSLDGVVPLSQFAQAAEAIADEARIRTLGWQVGERYDFQMLGPVGSAMFSCATLRAALHRFVDYFSWCRTPLSVH